MRITLALTIYVSLIATAFAGNTGLTQETFNEWKKTYDAGLEAGKQRNFEQAANLFRQSWDDAQAAGQKAASANNLAYICRKLNRDSDAAHWFERASNAYRTLPEQRYLFATSTVNLADIQRTRGDYRSAEAVLRSALSVPGSDSESAAVLRNALADLLREQGRASESAPLFQKSIDDQSLSSRQRIVALIGVADLQRQEGNVADSVSNWNRVLEIARANGDKSQEATALNGMAAAWLAGGQFARAEPLMRRALKLFEEGPETDTEQMAAALASIAALYRGENKLALAENCWSKALDIDRKILGEGHPQVAYLMEMLAELYSARGEFDLATEYSSRAVNAMSAALGEDSMATAAALTNKAIIEERANHLSAAASDYEQAIGIAKTHTGNRPMRAMMFSHYAGLLRTLHRGKEAKEISLQARTFLAVK